MWKYSHSLSSWNLIEVTLLCSEHIVQPKFKQDNLNKTKENKT